VILQAAGLRRLDHVGLTVPDLDEAVRFFREVFGAVVLVRHGPYQPAPASNVTNFARHPDTAVRGIALVQIAGGVVELLAYDAPDRHPEPPRTSDAGGHHVAFYVDDLDVAMQRLREAGIEVLGEPLAFAGDEAGIGARFVYVRAPWGLFLELVTYPNGKMFQQR
jgi:catechol 2,3-dioxygenase-like lactoylglutathione lyase family enzyme